MSILKKPLIGLTVILALIVISIPFQNKIDEAHGKFDIIKKSTYLPSSMLEKLSLGYTEILADIYWLRALQYFGGTNFSDQNPETLYKLFDIITDLDPMFVNAYRYGGAFLAEPPPFGLGEFDLGIKVFDKGREKNPDNYRLPLEQAFLYYLYPKDYPRAAELFDEAGSKPGVKGLRKASINGMAAAAHAQGGDRETSRKIWEIIYETNPSEGRRRFALQNLHELETMDIEDDLTISLLQYKEKFGKLPDGVEELVVTGFETNIPRSPLKGNYIIAPRLDAVKDSILAERNLDQNLRFLNAKSRRYSKKFGEYPQDLNRLKEYIELYTTQIFPPHPLGEDYLYDSVTGKVTAAKVPNTK